MALKRIFWAGYQYKKAGVMLMDLSPATTRQFSLLGETDPHSEKVMQTGAGPNREYGRNTVYLASEGIQHGGLCVSKTGHHAIRPGGKKRR